MGNKIISTFSSSISQAHDDHLPVTSTSSSSPSFLLDRARNSATMIPRPGTTSALSAADGVMPSDGAIQRCTPRARARCPRRTCPSGVRSTARWVPVVAAYRVHVGAHCRALPSSDCSSVENRVRFFPSCCDRNKCAFPFTWRSTHNTAVSTGYTSLPRTPLHTDDHNVPIRDCSDRRTSTRVEKALGHRRRGAVGRALAPFSPTRTCPPHPCSRREGPRPRSATSCAPRGRC